jgi:ABC-type lipoprotein release transport system permease subunit
VRVTLIGVVVGVASGWTLSTWLGSVQFGVTFFDPLTWATVVVGVVGASLLASWRPAGDAMRADPASLLREQ